MRRRSSLSSYIGARVWIIGGGSGIGAALAATVSARGAVVALSGRRAEALARTREGLHGSGHVTAPCDVSHPASVQHALRAIREAWNADPDVVVVMSAVGKKDRYAPHDPEETARMDAINITGLHLAAQTALDLFSARRTPGILALCGSAAGYMGMPDGRPYCAAKAATISLAESLYFEAPPHVDIKLISPGFVKTPMTANNNFPMPALLEAEEAARVIADGLLRSGFEIAFPKRFVIPLKIVRALPYALSLPLVRYLARRVKAKRQKI